jgi:hypothetical protein
MIEFAGRSFCFTGTMADLKRSHAERETRARGGLTTDIVNERLDYLVVGSIASIGWKHGDYGRKIEKARSMRDGGAPRPSLIPESDFVDALATCAAVNAGEIDSQVLVAVYKFLTLTPESYDNAGLQSTLAVIADEGYHVRASLAELSVAAGLFGGDKGPGFAVEVRFVRQLALDADVGSLASAIERRFEGIRGVDGNLRWFTRTEGSAEYIRLVRQIPTRLRLE